MPALEFEEWSHIYLASPLLHDLGLAWPIGWLAESDTGAPVGYLGNIPLDYELGARRLVAAATNAWVVDEGHRSASLLLLRAFFRQPAADLFLTTTANWNSGRALEAMRVRRTPVEACDVCLYWITEHRGFFTSALRKKNWRLPPAVTAIGSAGAAGFDHVQRAIRLPRKPGHVKVEWLSRFDGRFDRFWEMRRRDESLRFTRDRRSLTWLLEPQLRKHKAWIVTAETGGQMIGYGILLRRDNPDIGLTRMRLVDLQFRDGAADAVAAILSDALARCRRDGIHVVEAVGFNPAKRVQLKALGARQRRLGPWPFYYRARPDFLREALQRGDSWDPCELDGDGCF